MRDCPQWFQDELTNLGGVNQYGDPLFKLIWSPELRMTIGGRFHDGFEGYREKPLIGGEPCWALMIYEPASMFGSPDRWEWDYRDEESGLLDCGGFPKYGQYRLLQKFLHRELVEQQKERHWLDKDFVMRKEILSTPKMVTYRMEPCGFMLDVMLPMIKAWKKLSNSAKTAAIKQEEQLREEEYLKTLKDVHDGVRVRRGSQLVAKRAELIEKGMKQAMAMAAKSGLGMRIGD